ncbi:hypothetical protein MLD52_07170 [Puniceicoccaceae bacterium K14]|nr:hypothetical protein [Puniceicoccaceae bacterium K14]
MKAIFLKLLAIVALSILSGCKTTESTSQPAPDAKGAPKEQATQQYVFGWGNLPENLAKPRGGSSKGTPVELALTRSLPLESIANASSSFEKDRAAILSMAGSYKASFNFLETLGLSPEFEPTRPYHSWSTEQVRVLEDRGEFISLQHTLVMYFQKDDGSTQGPFVMKHWRQDWTYQDTDLHTFQGNMSWKHEKRSPASIVKSWTQTVWQVDDSPRYEVVGHWNHQGNRSFWQSEEHARPLPRREYSIRDDYGSLVGSHRITITPTGWVHMQNNWKRSANGEENETSFRGHEIGLNRYELITDPSLEKADDYWKKTEPYWSEVRAAWRDIFNKHKHFSLESKVDGRRQYELHFEYAGKLDSGEEIPTESLAKHARETINKYLITSPNSNEENNSSY